MNDQQSENNTPMSIEEELNTLASNEEGVEEESDISDSGEEKAYTDELDDCQTDGSEANDVSDKQVEIKESAVGNISMINIDLKNEEDSRFACPNCFTELDGSKYGKIICTNPACRKVVFRPGKIEIWEYRTLDPAETKEYNKIRAHIRNKLRDKNYLQAYRYCLKAELIAPAEVSTWEHFALSQFLFEITKEKTRRLPSNEIIKSIKAHLEKCNDYGIEADQYEILAGDIANKLFYIEKARIKSLRAQFKDELNFEKWSTRNLGYLRSLLSSFELSYSLYNDTLFLEEYVQELTKPHKWIVKTDDGLMSTPACGRFNAVNKLRMLVEKIREQKPDYESPKIADQREILIMQVEDLPGDKVQADDIQGIKILSVE